MKARSACRGDAGPGKRDRNLAERRPPAVAGNAMRMFDVGADVLEIAADNPQDERQTDELIDPE